MLIDNAIENFFLKYNRESMEYIDNLSSDLGLTTRSYKIKLFDIKESFDRANQYLQEYASYHVMYKDHPARSSKDVIFEAANKFVRNDICLEYDYKYADVSKFVQSYIEGVNTLLITIDECKSKMIDNDVAFEAVGDINDICDMFMTRINESFESSMDKLLMASGYTNAQRFKKSREPKPIIDTTESIFL